MHRPMQKVTVSRIRKLTPRISEFELSSSSGQSLVRGGPGTHIELYLPMPTGLVVRHYSLIGSLGMGYGHDKNAGRHAEDPPSLYRIAVQREDHGRGSAYIHDQFDIGTELYISHPIQNFPLARHVGMQDRHVLLIAGGIGITALYPMLRSLNLRKRPFTIAYAGRSLDEMAYAHEVMQLAGARGAFYLSQVDKRNCEKRLGSSANIQFQRIDFPSMFKVQPKGTRAYICGPQAMIGAAQKAAQELGWPEGALRYEHFSTGSVLDEMAFDVELKKSGRKIHVGRDTSILDALSAEGVHMLADCRRGECGLCPVPVVSLDGEIDHRDRYLDEGEKAAQDQLCICVSRIRGKHLVLDA